MFRNRWRRNHRDFFSLALARFCLESLFVRSRDYSRYASNLSLLIRLAFSKVWRIMSNERIDKKLDNSVPFLPLFHSLCHFAFPNLWQIGRVEKLPTSKKERKKEGRREGKTKYHTTSDRTWTAPISRLRVPDETAMENRIISIKVCFTRYPFISN